MNGNGRERTEPSRLIRTAFGARPMSLEALRERVRGRVVTTSAELGVRIIEPIERWIGRRSPIGDTPFYDTDRFPWVAELERHWTEIRDELEQVLLDRSAIPAFQDISVDQIDLSDDDRWQTYSLFGYGFEVAEHTAACPRTTELVPAVPGMKTAMFSTLAPGKHIPHHRGPYKGVLRHHLGLIVPDPPEACRIRVGDEIRHWEEGASLLLDDTYDHEVWNDTDGQRVRAVPRCRVSADRRGASPQQRAAVAHRALPARPRRAPPPGALDGRGRRSPGRHARLGSAPAPAGTDPGPRVVRPR